MFIWTTCRLNTNILSTLFETGLSCACIWALSTHTEKLSIYDSLSWSVKDAIQKKFIFHLTTQGKICFTVSSHPIVKINLLNLYKDSKYSWYVLAYLFYWSYTQSDYLTNQPTISHMLYSSNGVWGQWQAWLQLCRIIM